jgi:hypothetical protein
MPTSGTEPTAVTIAEHVDGDGSVACCIHCLYSKETERMVEPPTVHPDGTALGRKRGE